MLPIFNTVSAIDFFDNDDDENTFFAFGINQYVKLADQDDSSLGKNEHPVELGVNNLKLALEALEIKDEGLFFSDEEESFKHIFSVQQVRTLADTISEGLRKANSEQDIIFSLVKSDKGLLGMQQIRYLAGRAFYKDNKLNIIIGDYDFFSSKAFEKEYDPGRNQVPYNLSHGYRLKASKVFDGIHLNVPGVNNKQLANELRHDWIVIDVNATAKAYVDLKNNKGKEETVNDKAIKKEAAKLAKQRREMRAEMARMRKEVKDISSKESSSKSIEGRITTLDQLLSKKLITQDEYDAKREKILNEI